MSAKTARICIRRIVATVVFSACVAGSLLASSTTFARERNATLDDAALRALTAQAYIYTLPSVIMFKTREGSFRRAAFMGREPVNQFAHQRTAATPASRAVTTPSPDLLYTSAWLDLASGPVTLTVPKTAQRYYSLQFMDFFTNSFAYIGRRTGTIAGGKFLIVGPGWRGATPADHELVRAPTNAVWLLGRFLVDDNADALAVNTLQDGLQLTVLQSQSNPGPQASWDGWDKDDPLHHFVIANRALTENPPPKKESNLMHEFAQIGVGPGIDFAPAILSKHRRKIMQTAIANARQRLARWVAQVPGVKEGWSQPSAELRNYGQAYFFRALVAKTGLGANIPQEAMYFRVLTDDAGERPNGAHRYELHFPAGALPPVDAFWSITAYRREPDLRQFLVENEINRYAIGSRTPGLQRNSDGSLTIYLQHEAPQKDRESNWLPIPADSVGLILRAYQPRAALLNAQYQLPVVRRVQ